ncbi:alkaline shock response membrane anchor protein AmaP [Tichowtungia aerotolerans]|uniref:Alkaline shock response membrane anchor protein AmaP n=1 Tax=Tichowtungia aerotolerans TaxID=2697043 RepID=A0A6P1M0Z5_9BACT|nr:alkaline shock response membrane anchor protein AmaP [Tichowtungia aerotolerans]QHI68230.1 alkaline shock response membrane anchor protein AmaP [Tichowtungia aerotolerans]
MKKLLHALAGALIFLTPLVWSALLVYGNGFNTGFRDFIFSTMTDSPFVGVVFGLILILLVLVYLGTFGRPRSRKRYISFESESGSVSISINAVRDFVRKIGDEFGSVVSMDPKIHSEKNMLCIDLDVKIQTGSRLPELSEKLQGRVRESIRDGLGIVDVREIKVKVQEIVGAPPASPID